MFELLRIFQVGKIIRRAKKGHLRLAGVFLDKVTSDIEFTDEAVVQCDFCL